MGLPFGGTTVSMRFFTREEVTRCNGRSAPAYVIFKGIVYDVTGSFHWKEGKHQVLHQAGEDLTEQFEQAPHTAELLKRFPVAGILNKDDD